MQTTGLRNWTLVALLDPGDSILGQELKPTPAVVETLGALRALRKDIALGQDQTNRYHALHAANILAGRRHSVQGPDGEAFRKFSNQLITARLRTYDFLLDRAADLFGGTRGARA
jgi:hypothetical protein